MSEEESEGSIKDFIDNSSDESEAVTTASDKSDSDSDLISVHSDESVKKMKKKARQAEKAAAGGKKGRAAATTTVPQTRRTRANADPCTFVYNIRNGTPK